MTTAETIPVTEPSTEVLYGIRFRLAVYALGMLHIPEDIAKAFEALDSIEWGHELSVERMSRQLAQSMCRETTGLPSFVVRDRQGFIRAAKWVAFYADQLQRHRLRGHRKPRHIAESIFRVMAVDVEDNETSRALFGASQDVRDNDSGEFPPHVAKTFEALLNQTIPCEGIQPHHMAVLVHEASARLMEDDGITYEQLRDHLVVLP